jgi:hypothetical protein
MRWANSAGLLAPTSVPEKASGIVPDDLAEKTDHLYKAVMPGRFFRQPASDFPLLSR